jgi:hypothetical protein
LDLDGFGCWLWAYKEAVWPSSKNIPEVVVNLGTRVVGWSFLLEMIQHFGNFGGRQVDNLKKDPYVDR